MSHRAWWLVIVTLVLLGIALAVHDALRPPPGGDAPLAPRAPSATASGHDAASPDATVDADMVAAMATRDAAIAEAVDTLHAYGAALFRTDRSEADGYWLDGRAPAGEADLRGLPRVTGLRLENGAPEAVDPVEGADVPAALRIPVRLRVAGDGPLRRYAGHYQLQRTAAGWRIVSASIEPSPSPR